MVSSHLGQTNHMIPDFYQQFGWTLALIAAVFALGLTAPFARRFYPGSPGFRRRLAAPLIFGAWAVACCIGFGRVALFLVAFLGLILIAITRWRHHREKRAI